TTAASSTPSVSRSPSPERSTMDLGLRDHVALVTGGSRGIGLEIARVLAAEGCRLLLCARAAEPLDEAAAMLRQSTGAAVETIALDVTAPDAPAALARALDERFAGRLDVLVNNVGGNRRKPFVDTTDDDWSTVLELNLGCHVRATRALLPRMIAQQSGSIVFVASIFGREGGGPGLSIYNTTKSALISLAKILA